MGSLPPHGEAKAENVSPLSEGLLPYSPGGRGGTATAETKRRESGGNGWDKRLPRWDNLPLRLLPHGRLVLLQRRGLLCRNFWILPLKIGSVIFANLNIPELQRSDPLCRKSWTLSLKTCAAILQNSANILKLQCPK